jgi:tyrosinase
MSASPIWDANHGFGGNGDTNSPITLHDGHCVVDGPFSNTTRAWSALSQGHSHDVVYSPHCLSRGFVSNPELSHKLHKLILPEHIQETLSQPDYNSFFKMFEQGAHNAIPQFLRGDWLTFTAPNGQ